MPRLQALRDRLGASLWTLPLGMMLAAAALAVAALRVRLPLAGKVPWLYSGTAREAPNFLASLLGSMITMGTLSISITMVVLTLAAQQLGPRLVYRFIGDRRTQAAVGLFLGTIVYLLLVLRAVHGEAGGADAPNLAVTVGTALVLASVVTLLFFTHHLARSIMSDTVIDGVGASLDAEAERLLPPEAEPDRPGEPPPAPGPSAPLSLPRGGYIQAVHHEGLVAAARAENAAIRLLYRPGHHVLPHAAHARVSPPSARTPALRRAFEEALVVGGERTPGQDLEFSIRQLVEIALRALSPGMNDTYTALAVIDRLTLSLARIARRGPARGAWRDKDGVVRLLAPVSTFGGQMDAAFDQIRQAGGDYPAVLIRLLEQFGQLAEIADPVQRPVIAEHVVKVAAAGRKAIPDERDLRAFEDCVRSAESKLGQLDVR